MRDAERERRGRELGPVLALMEPRDVARARDAVQGKGRDAQPDREPRGAVRTTARRARSARGSGVIVVLGVFP